MLLATVEVEIERDKAEELRRLIRRIVSESGVSQQQLARDAGLSYAAVHAWLVGARAPRPESLLQLIDGLEARANELQRLASSLKAEARRYAR